MTSNKLQVLDRKLPLKSYVGNQVEEILKTKFKFWVSNLLSIKADNEDKVDLALPIIQQKFWSMGFDDITKAFEMYALGELNIKPIPNHFDIILVGQIFNEFKKTLISKPEKMDESKYKKEQDDLLTIQCFDRFIQDRKISTDMVWIYTYLEDKIDASDRDKKTLFSIAKEQKVSDEEAVVLSKLKLLRRYFEKLEAKDKHIKDIL